MNQYINYSIISKLPKDHFGQLTDEVLHLLTNGECCVVYSLPGGGISYFSKQINFLLSKQFPYIKTINLSLELENNKVEVLNKELSKLSKIKNIDEINLDEYLRKNKIIIILNEVDSPKYKKFYKYLNALRNINKDNLTILTVGYYTLFKYSNKYLKNACDVFHPLKRLNNFDLEGVKRIIKINNSHYGWNIPLSLTKKILFLSGGHPALVKYISNEVDTKGEKILNFKNKLVKSQPINFRLSEITKLITKLTIEEQFQIGILNNNGTLFSDLLVEYLKTNEIEGLDKLFPDLTKLDRKILTLFVRNSEKVINKDQLSIILEQTADSYSEWAIYKAVARVRKKIKDKYNIKTLKGRGWIMESK